MLRRLLANRPRALIAAACCTAIAIPFLVVRWAPITDLPQHVAQIPLLLDALGNPDSPYAVQWLTPYSLVYAIIGVCWLLFGSIEAGKIALLAIGLISTIALHATAARRGRPVATAVLLSVLFFSQVTYWGFYQFALGWPAFLLWLEIVRREYRSVAGEIAALAACSALLYVSHVLWLGVAIGWLAIGDLIFRRRWKSMAYRLAAVIPVLALVAIWYPTLAEYGFDSNTIWTLNPLERIISLVWLFTATLGGLFGPVDYIVYAALILWAIAGIAQHWKKLRFSVDVELVLLGSLFILVALCLPDCVQRTINFAKRWIPFGTALLLLGLPAPRIRHPLVPGIIAGLVLAVYCAMTAASWVRFEETEMTGFTHALERLPRTQRVLSLDFVKHSEILRGRPFMQAFAYGQVLKGGTLNFSFADFGPSLVRYKEPREIPWSESLEWYPSTFDKKKDLRYFDYVLINDTGSLHQSAIRAPELEPVTHRERWRLYRVTVNDPDD